MTRLLFLFRHFRACRLFLPPLIPAEWAAMRNRPSTYRLWLMFRSDLA